MKLTGLIVTEQWTDVLERLETHPKEAEAWDNGVLPIHCACRRPKVPVKVVESLIKVYKLSLGQKSQPLGLLPLHCALEPASSTNIPVVKLLLENYKKAAMIKDEHERMPLHFHLWSCTKPSLDVVKLLVQAHPIAVSTGDRLDRYPLHYSAKGGQWEITQFLVELFPDGLTKKSFGQTPLDWFQGTQKDQMLKALHDDQVKNIREKVELEKKSKILESTEEASLTCDETALVSWSFERCQAESIEEKQEEVQKETLQKDETQKKIEQAPKEVQNQIETLQHKEENTDEADSFEKYEERPSPSNETVILQPKENQNDAGITQQEKSKNEENSSMQKLESTVQCEENDTQELKNNQPITYVVETPSTTQEEDIDKSFQMRNTFVEGKESNTITKVTPCDIPDDNSDDEQRLQQKQEMVRETLQQEEEELRKLREQLEEAGVGSDSTQMDDINLNDDASPSNPLQGNENDEEVEKKIDLLRNKLHGDEEELRNMRARLREEEESIFGISYLPSTPSVRNSSPLKEANQDMVQTPKKENKENINVLENKVSPNVLQLNMTKRGKEIDLAISPPSKQSQQQNLPEENDFTSRLLGFMTCWSPGRKMQYD